MSNVSKLLTKNEQPWAIRSGRLEEMSDRERIAQVAHQNWVNERIARFFSESLIRKFLAKNERFAQKTNEQIQSPAFSSMI